MDNPVTKIQIDYIRDLISHKARELRGLTDSLTTLQSICQHDMVYQGHGHNYNVYECSVCTFTEHS